MKNYIVRDVAKELGISYDTITYHFKYLKEGVDYIKGTQGDQFNPSTITDEALLRIANSGRFSKSQLLLRFLELNKDYGLDVPSEESDELANCKKALEYLQDKYNELEEESNKDKGVIDELTSDFNRLIKERLELRNSSNSLADEVKNLSEKNNELSKKTQDNSDWQSALKNAIETLSENSKEFDVRTKLLLIWNILISVILALSFLK